MNILSDLKAICNGTVLYQKESGHQRIVYISYNGKYYLYNSHQGFPASSSLLIADFELDPKARSTYDECPYHIFNENENRWYRKSEFKDVEFCVGLKRRILTHYILCKQDEYRLEKL